MSDIRASARFRQLRALVIARARGRCVDCGATGPKPMHVDHVIPLSEGGDPWALSNLACRCASCHREKDRDVRLAASSWRKRFR